MNSVSRKKLSEYRSKLIMSQVTHSEYVGYSIAAETISESIDRIPVSESYVVKVDQAIKGRFKKGLVLLDVKKDAIEASLRSFEAKGFEWFLVEPYVTHEDQQERYISFSYDRNGYFISFSDKGGVNIESHPESVETLRLNDGFDWITLAEKTKLSASMLTSIFQIFKEGYFTLLEINPYVVASEVPTILDVAIEVDDAGSYFTDTWHKGDIREMNNLRTKQEKIVQELNNGSAASFNLSVLNPNGSIFLLLSGGGASVVIADEVYNKGFGKQLANYGEYSGNPDLYETYRYTSQVIELILNSTASKKVLFIGGAVANFTDIATTFAGIIKAIDEYAPRLQDQDLSVYVRRGGPNQEVGLENIEKCLKQHNVFGGVYNPSTTLSEALTKALEGLNK